MKSDPTAHCSGPRLRRAVLLSLVCLLPTLGFAQDAGRPVSCRFLCMEGATPPEALLCGAEKGLESVCTVPANAPSAAIVLFAKDNRLKFLTPKDRKQAATATIPASVKSAILLFIPVAQPQPQSALPWRVFVIDDSDKSYPDGGAYVANFYNKNIRFVIGEHKIMLPPARSHGFARPEQRDNFNMAQVAFEFQEEQTWRSVSESLLRFLPGMRYLVIAYVDPASGRPRLFVSTDIKPAFTPPVKSK